MNLLARNDCATDSSWGFHVQSAFRMRHRPFKIPNARLTVIRVRECRLLNLLSLLGISSLMLYGIMRCSDNLYPASPIKCIPYGIKLCLFCPRLDMLQIFLSLEEPGRREYSKNLAFASTVACILIAAKPFRQIHLQSK